MNTEMPLPNISEHELDMPDLAKLTGNPIDHPPRILLLYGLRERSYSRLLTLESMVRCASLRHAPPSRNSGGLWLTVAYDTG